jgi:hypothetical protein
LFLKVYNVVLRQPTEGAYQAELYQAFKEKKNLFPTTIHVLVSSIVKLTQSMKIPTGFRLYRGLSGKELPASFYQHDKQGRQGYMEWGFMSTTSDKQIAVQVIFDSLH